MCRVEKKIRQKIYKLKRLKILSLMSTFSTIRTSQPRKWRRLSKETGSRFLFWLRWLKFTKLTRRFFRLARTHFRMRPLLANATRRFSHSASVDGTFGAAVRHIQAGVANSHLAVLANGRSIAKLFRLTVFLFARFGFGFHVFRTRLTFNFIAAANPFFVSVRRISRLT